jgi:carnitine O-acetyltransferase
VDIADEKDHKRYELLLKACSAHNDLSKACSAGKGIDRYLMGLKVQLRNNEIHPLFEDEFYSKSQEWKLSTSAFSPGQNFLGVGFGAAWADGYGINCMSPLSGRGITDDRSTWETFDQIRD